MRQETIKIYQFEELNKEAQEKAIENEMNNEFYLDYDWWDSDFEEFNERLKNVGLDCETFNFDIYQHSFEIVDLRIDDYKKFFKAVDLDRWIISKSLGTKEEIEEFEELLYNSEFNKDGEFDFYGYNCGNEEETINEYIKDLKVKFLKSLQEQYDYLLSDEAIKEHLTINEYEFEENGKIY